MITSDPKIKKKVKQDIDWTGFAFPKQSKRLSPYKYAKLKRKIHQMDGWRCVNPDCTEIYTRDQLQVHHIVPKGRLVLDTVDNGATTCPVCHSLVEDKLIYIDFEKAIKRRKLAHKP